MPIYMQTDKHGVTRYFIQGSESWDDFPNIVNKVQQALDTSVVEQVDGPDSRLCILSVGGYEIAFVHDDMFGNFFFTQDTGAKEAIQAISVLFSDSTDG
jgi:hypothetical protein